MKSRYSRISVWASITLWSAAIAFATNQEPPQSEKGEQIPKAIASCHELKPISQQFMDKGEWAEMIAMMVQRGAKIKADDPVERLPRKKIRISVAGWSWEGHFRIHLQERLPQRAANCDEAVVPGPMDALLDEMLSNGAEISDDDYPGLLNYLARNFKPTPAQ